MSIPVISRDRKHRPLVAGNVIAGLLVLKAHPAERVAEQRYLVRYLCCGTEKYVSHKAVMLRHSCGRKVCVVCRNKAKSKYAPVVRETAGAMRSRGQSVAKISRAVAVPEGTVQGWLM
jgi:hypothetical protein